MMKTHDTCREFNMDHERKRWLKKLLKSERSGNLLKQFAKNLIQGVLRTGVFIKNTKPRSMKIRLTVQGSVSETCSGSNLYSDHTCPSPWNRPSEKKYKPVTGTCEAGGR